MSQRPPAFPRNPLIPSFVGVAIVGVAMTLWRGPVGCSGNSPPIAERWVQDEPFLAFAEHDALVPRPGPEFERLADDSPLLGQLPRLGPHSQMAVYLRNDGSSLTIASFGGHGGDRKLAALAEDIASSPGNERLLQQEVGRGASRQIRLWGHRDGVYFHARLHSVVARDGRFDALSVLASGAYPEELLAIQDGVRVPDGSVAPKDLLSARSGFSTTLLPAPSPPTAYPLEAPALVAGAPGRSVFVEGPVGPLAAYLTDEPPAGERRPALLWAHGGFRGTSPDFCFEGFPAAFVDAGYVVLCPTWRGEPGNPGRQELFYGELEDAQAALSYLTSLPYVDPARVYVAGHSTGGTLTLLLAESTPGIRAAFSFGGAFDLWGIVQDGVGYGNTPFEHTDFEESYVRSPIHFIAGLQAPVFYFEGALAGDELIRAAAESVARPSFAPLEAFLVPGQDHHSVVRPIMELLVERLETEAVPVLWQAEVEAAFPSAADHGPADDGPADDGPADDGSADDGPA